MKKSIFQDGSIAYWVDYSNRPDCLEVIEISEEQYLEEIRPVEPVIEETIEETIEEIIEE